MTPQEERRKRLEDVAYEIGSLILARQIDPKTAIRIRLRLEREIDAAVEQEREAAGTILPTTTRVMYCWHCKAGLNEAHGFIFRRVCKDCFRVGCAMGGSESPAAKGEEKP